MTSLSSHKGARHDLPSPKDWRYTPAQYARDRARGPFVQHATEVLDQGAHLSCVHNALRAMCLSIDPTWDVSRMWGWRESRIKEGHLYTDSPIMIRTALDILRKQGSPPEHVYPYEDRWEFMHPPHLDGKMWRHKPFQAFKLDLADGDGQRCLELGYPFIALMRMTDTIEKQLAKPDQWWLDKPNPDEPTLGYHAMLWRWRTRQDGANIVQGSYGADVGVRGCYETTDEHLMDPHETGSAWSIRL